MMENSVLVTLFYRADKKPEKKSQTFTDAQRFLECVNSFLGRKLNFTRVVIDDESGLRQMVWLRNVNMQEAKYFKAKGVWEKGPVHLTEIDFESEDSIERMFSFMRERMDNDA